jgi:hypothetical protein
VILQLSGASREKLWGEVGRVDHAPHSPHSPLPVLSSYNKSFFHPPKRLYIPFEIRPNRLRLNESRRKEERKKEEGKDSESKKDIPVHPAAFAPSVFSDALLILLDVEVFLPLLGLGLLIFRFL